jgi:single-stranded-DNA-specific exonuclease
MPSLSKRWVVAQPAPPDHMAACSHLHPLVAQALYNRGVREAAAIQTFLAPPAQFNDPFAILDLRQAVERIRAAITAREQIVVYGDFDADGVTATALLVQTLKALGANVDAYIPHRVDEGYGLHCESLDRIAARGAQLVITVDCGIRSAKEVAYGQSLGMHMIVTDHHDIQQDEHGCDILPPALAVVNTKRQGDPYAFKGLAGVGIAFKLAQGLMRLEATDPVAPGPVMLKTSDLLDLVALGTVADIAPLLDENRYLVQRGLAELNHPRRPGLIAMLAESKLPVGKVSAYSIGFVLGPRLNAAGRLASAQIGYELLTAADVLSAKVRADELGRLNRERQEKTQELVERAKERIATDGDGRYLYFLGGEAFHPGIVGLVAGRITEDLYRPSIVVEVGPTESRGSCRSIPEFNITRGLDECRELLVRHGGHAMAAGLTVKNENLPELQRRMEAIAARELAGRDLTPVIAIDAEYDLAERDAAFCGLLRQLEPYGEANPQPVFVSQGLEVVRDSPRLVGGDGRHLKLRVRARGSRLEWEVIAFRMGAWYDGLPARIDLAYCLEVNDFNGGLQLNAKDLRPAW